MKMGVQKMNRIARLAIPSALLLGLAACAAEHQTAANDDMTFFVTSVGSSNGADLGGLVGADQHCQQLAEAAGAGDHTWRAYLSTQSMGGQSAVNARDRIGQGPWHNANATLIASNLTELHGTNKITKQTALTEKGEIVNGRGDSPNMHDILTGTQSDGTAFAGSEDRTCGNWTESGAQGAAMLGHHDRQGLSDDPPAKSWNSSHLSRGGCSQTALKGTGGAGLFYCFASD
jgi:hypothetical protein